MNVALGVYLKPKIEELLESLGRIADASERTADALDALVRAQADPGADSAPEGEPEGEPSRGRTADPYSDLDLDRL